MSNLLLTQVEVKRVDTRVVWVTLSLRPAPRKLGRTVCALRAATAKGVGGELLQYSSWSRHAVEDPVDVAVDSGRAVGTCRHRRFELSKRGGIVEEVDKRCVGTKRDNSAFIGLGGCRRELGEPSAQDQTRAAGT